MIDDHHEQLDHELDAALAKYSAVEPRPGLEGRILANLRAEQARVPGRAWWRWSAVVVAAVIIIAVVAALRPERRHEDNRARQATPTQNPTQLVANREDHGTAQAVRVPPRATMKHSIHPAAPVPPRLDQFPTPQPLSEQELALARYVNEFPQDATLIARAQEEYEQEIQQKMKDERSETDAPGSEQPER